MMGGGKIVALPFLHSGSRWDCDAGRRFSRSLDDKNTQQFVGKRSPTTETWWSPMEGTDRNRHTDRDDKDDGELIGRTDWRG